MKKSVKIILIILACAVLVGAAAAFFVCRSSSGYIGRAAALDYALEHAGVAAADVIEKDVDMERHGGKVWYEVDFDTFGTEYEYSIDAFSGAVLHAKSEPRG